MQFWQQKSGGRRSQNSEVRIQKRIWVKGLGGAASGIMGGCERGFDYRDGAASGCFAGGSAAEAAGGADSSGGGVFVYGNRAGVDGGDGDGGRAGWAGAG